MALHGYGASLFSWRYLASALPDRRVIRVDLAGHGASPPRKDGRYSLADHSEQLIDFIDEQKLDEFDLIGHSLGGGVALMTALDFAKRRRHSIGRLILVGSAALPQPLPLIMRLARAPWIGPLLLRCVPAGLVVPNALRGAFHDRRRVTKEMIQNYAHNLTTAKVRRAMVETARQIFPDDLTWACCTLSYSASANAAHLG